MSNFHVALIMDGNGRWATQQGKPRIWGHKQGAKVLKNIIRLCPDHGITHLTAYAFSPENWKRSTTEVHALMRLFQVYLRVYTEELHQEGVKLCIIGNRDPLPPLLQRMIIVAEQRTQHNKRLILQIALNYGGRDDLLQATQRLVAQCQRLEIDSQTLTQKDIEQALWTHHCPDPDLLIRTGGEMRLSNYMLWQLSYTELIFMPEYWPDFTAKHLEHAVTQFRLRQRRFGSVPLSVLGPALCHDLCDDARISSSAFYEEDKKLNSNFPKKAECAHSSGSSQGLALRDTDSHLDSFTGSGRVNTDLIPKNRKQVLNCEPVLTSKLTDISESFITDESWGQNESSDSNCTVGYGAVSDSICAHSSTVSFSFSIAEVKEVEFGRKSESCVPIGSVQLKSFSIVPYISPSISASTSVLAALFLALGVDHFIRTSTTPTNLMTMHKNSRVTEAKNCFQFGGCKRLFQL